MGIAIAIMFLVILFLVNALIKSEETIQKLEHDLRVLSQHQNRQKSSEKILSTFIKERGNVNANGSI